MNRAVNGWAGMTDWQIPLTSHLELSGEFYRGNECPDDLKRKYDQMYAETMCSVIRDALDRSGVDLTEITAVLPNNVNRFSWRRTGRTDAQTGEERLARIRPPQGGFRTDPYATAVFALEHFDSTHQTATKADIFRQRVVAPRAPRLGADTPADALAICLDQHGEVRLDEVANKTRAISSATESTLRVGEAFQLGR